MEIKEIEEILREFTDANAGGPFSPRYGRLMIDRSDGEIWVDIFYSVGHNEWKEYHNPAIVDLEREYLESEFFKKYNYKLSAAGIKALADKLCHSWQSSATN